MKKYSFMDVIKEKTVIKCSNKEQQLKLFEELDKKGLTWRSGRRYLYTIPFSSNACFEICFEISTGEWSKVSYFKQLDYKIIDFEDVEFDKEKLVFSETKNLKMKFICG